MWKLFGKKFRSGASTANSVASSVTDLRGKFSLEKHCTHGFPLGPSCMTFDPHRRVLFIGTNSGELRMLGRPGVELAGLHDDTYKVSQILPFATEASVITISNNNLMHKWSLVDSEGNSRLVLKRTYKFQGGLAKTITVCCLPPYCDCLFVGTLGGITYPMDTEFDGMSPEVLSWSRARAYLKYRGKDIPGEVRTLEISPTNPKQLLIGYEHSYLELWDALAWKPLSILGPYKDGSDILSVCWHSDGKRFVSSHQDGSMAFWNLSHPAQPYMIKKLHENERCQEISRVLWPSDNLLVMSGGAPLDEVDGDSITISNNDETFTLQLTSPVRGMHILEDAQADRDSGIVNAGPDADNSTMVRKVLILLLEQEILFIDLRLPELPLLRPPYLFSMHNSPVKCVEVASHVNKDLWQTIAQVGRVQQEAIYRASAKVWPIDGGMVEALFHDHRDILLSGHEDGTVKFWDIRESAMGLLYTVNCGPFFNSLDSDFMRTDSPVEQPQCRQIGFWDPRSDDDHMIVTAMHFREEELVIGFQGGLALIFHINNQSANVNIQLVRVSIMRDDPRQRGRNWQAPLEARTDSVECGPGYQPSHCISLFPNVAITALAIATHQNLLGVGCIYGFCIVDYLKNTIIHVHSTFEQVQPEYEHLSRMQSIRRSFRQSLKRLNVRRSMRGMQSMQRSYRPNLVRSGSARPSLRHQMQGGGGVGAKGGGAVGGGVTSAAEQPLKRDTIRTIAFSAPSHIAGHHSVPSILVGTNQGSVFGFTIDLPSSKHRDSRSPIIMPIEKEFNVKKNQAILFVGVMDGHNYLLDSNDKGSYHPKGGHYLIVVTEDTIKMLTLPHMKKKYRVKIKRHDDDELHIVSAHYVRVQGQSGILVMDSEGYVSVYSLPDLKLTCREDCVDASDAIGQRYFVCSSIGVLLHQRSPSEFTHGSITEDARMEFHFTVPCELSYPLQLSPTPPKSLEGGPFLEVTLPQSPVVTTTDSPGTPLTTGIESASETDDQIPVISSPEERAFQERAL